MKYQVYILYSESTDKYYVGSTGNLEESTNKKAVKKRLLRFILSFY
jgi:predicted GIY-YIG superfamily endonuclease